MKQRTLLPVLATISMVWAAPVCAAPVWHTDPATCRILTDAVLHGRVNAAADALTPDNATDAMRPDIRDLAQRLVDGVGAATSHLRPHLERALPDQALAGPSGDIPVSLELWTFGEQQAYLVGCAIRPMGDYARVSIQAYPTLGDINAHLAHELWGQPLPGDDQEP